LFFGSLPFTIILLQSNLRLHFEPIEIAIFGGNIKKNSLPALKKPSLCANIFFRLTTFLSECGANYQNSVVFGKFFSGLIRTSFTKYTVPFIFAHPKQGYYEKNRIRTQGGGS
jgi:hypothetical protein